MGSVLDNFITEVAAEAGIPAVGGYRARESGGEMTASSALTDIRDMARRYRKLRDLDAISLDSWSVDGTAACEMPILIRDEEEETEGTNHRRARLALAAVSTVALAAATAALALVLQGHIGKPIVGGASASLAASPQPAQKRLAAIPGKSAAEPSPVEDTTSSAMLATREEADARVVDQETGVAREETSNRDAPVAEQVRPRSARRVAAKSRSAIAEEEAREPRDIDPSWAASPPPVVEPDAPQCDEVLCLLEGHACCGEKEEEPASAVAKPDLPDELSRSDIEEALQPVSGRLAACGSKHGVVGAATVKFKILGSGQVASAATATGDSGFQQCIATVAKKTVFHETAAGVTVSYPIIMR